VFWRNRLAYIFPATSACPGSDPFGDAPDTSTTELTFIYLIVGHKRTTVDTGCFDGMSDPVVLVRTPSMHDGQVSWLAVLDEGRRVALRTRALQGGAVTEMALDTAYVSVAVSDGFLIANDRHQVIRTKMG
jgi:hypothetical protein